MPLTESDGAKLGPVMSTKPMARPGGGCVLIQRESASSDTRVSPVAMSTRPATPSVSFTIGASSRMPIDMPPPTSKLGPASATFLQQTHEAAGEERRIEERRIERHGVRRVLEEDGADAASLTFTFGAVVCGTVLSRSACTAGVCMAKRATRSSATRTMASATSAGSVVSPALERETSAKPPPGSAQRAKTASVPAASSALPTSMRAPPGGLAPAAKATSGRSAAPLTAMFAGPTLPVKACIPLASKASVATTLLREGHARRVDANRRAERRRRDLHLDRPGLQQRGGPPARRRRAARAISVRSRRRAR